MSKAKLALRASELGVLKATPAGSLDAVLYVPDQVWTNDAYAKRWFKSGCYLAPPARQGRSVPKASYVQLGKLTKRIKQRARAWGRDYRRDVGDAWCEDASWDLADGLLLEAGYSDRDRKRLRESLADYVHDGITSLH